MYIAVLMCAWEFDHVKKTFIAKDLKLREQATGQPALRSVAWYEREALRKYTLTHRRRSFVC